MDPNSWIHDFEAGSPDESETLCGEIGPKGHSLTQMTALGVPVPPGFVLTTEACAAFHETEGAWPEAFHEALRAALARMEETTGQTLGAAANPLLIAVRSGLGLSMPGMRTTVLNLGLNDEGVEAWAEASGDPRFVYDTYRRAIEMYGDVVLGIHRSRFLQVNQAYMEEGKDLDAAVLKEICAALLEVISDQGRALPQDPLEQVLQAAEALFRSHNSHRARYFRKARGIPDGEGMSLLVQAMVFGNRLEKSGAGVVFSRNPNDGEPGLFGEWFPNSQGGDLEAGGAAGSSTQEAGERGIQNLQTMMPKAYEELSRIQGILEAHHRDMQLIEFTIDSDRLYILQSRSGERTAQAAVKIVVDMVQDGMLGKAEGLGRVDPKSLEMLMRPLIHPDAKRKVIASGLGASPGAAYGRVVFEASECQAYMDRDEPTILVRRDTSPEDIQGIMVAQGVLAARGGQTSHAAVVARGMGRPCVVGCTEIYVDYTRALFYAGDTVVQKGDWITIDGTTGEVLEGQVEMLTASTESVELQHLLGWADEVARLGVRANVDTGSDAVRARALGVVGIGLCRTEHMFFEQDALRAIRKLILADDPRARQRAVHEIVPAQRAVFMDMFRAMDGLPVTIRLLDPPLQDFLPQREADLLEVANDLGVNAERLYERLEQLKETNPMLGHRGVRLGVTSPEIYQAQVRAILEAACECVREGISVRPEIMVPLVGLTAELQQVRERVEQTAQAVLTEYEQTVDYAIGTMIEVPRAALIADRLALHADFFSFGTNDLTQLMYGWSRDDAGKFLVHYQQEGLLAESPLTCLDEDGVGEIMKVAVERGREANPRLLLGVCGEHGGDPVAIGFFHRLGLDYVSCSPYRVPVARLAAAHAALGLL